MKRTYMTNWIAFLKFGTMMSARFKKHFAQGFFVWMLQYYYGLFVFVEMNQFLQKKF